MQRLLVFVFLVSSAYANEPRFPDEGSPPDLGEIPTNGILLCIGMSQAVWECTGAPPGAGGWVATNNLPIPVVNGANSGWDTRRIMADPAEYWSRVENNIRQAGYTNADVVLIWGKNATKEYECPTIPGTQQCDVDAETLTLQSHLEAIQDEAERRFPNLIAGFHSSRTSGLWCRANGEPLAYRTIDAVEGAVADESKWFVGPYIWASDTPRADGLFYTRDDFVYEPVAGPGCHPSASGVTKVSQELDQFFGKLTFADGAPPPGGDPVLSASFIGNGQFELSWTGEASTLTCGSLSRSVAASPEIVTLPDELAFNQQHSCTVSGSNSVTIGCRSASDCRVF